MSGIGMDGRDGRDGKDGKDGKPGINGTTITIDSDKSETATNPIWSDDDNDDESCSCNVCDVCCSSDAGTSESSHIYCMDNKYRCGTCELGADEESHEVHFSSPLLVTYGVFLQMARYSNKVKITYSNLTEMGFTIRRKVSSSYKAEDDDRDLKFSWMAIAHQ